MKDLGASLRGRIVKLYAQVLRYQIRLAKHYAHSSFFRSLQDVFVADNWKEMLVSITDMEDSITGDLEILAGHTIQGIDRKVAELGHLMDESLRLGRETRDEVKVSLLLYILYRRSPDSRRPSNFTFLKACHAPWAQYSDPLRTNISPCA